MLYRALVLSVESWKGEGLAKSFVTVPTFGINHALLALLNNSDKVVAMKNEQ